MKKLIPIAIMWNGVLYNPGTLSEVPEDLALALDTYSKQQEELAKEANKSAEALGMPLQSMNTQAVDETVVVNQSAASAQPVIDPTLVEVAKEEPVPAPEIIAPAVAPTDEGVSPAVASQDVSAQVEPTPAPAPKPATRKATAAAPTVAPATEPIPPAAPLPLK